VRHQGVVDLLRGIGPFDAAIKSFGILTEDGHVDHRLFNLSGSSPADEVQRIPGIGFAGAQADVEAEMLAQAHDRTGIDEVFGLEFGGQFGKGGILGFGGDGSEKADFVFFKQVDGALRQGVPLAAPKLPADVPFGIVRFKSGSLQHAEGLFQHHPAYSVAGESYDGSFGHLLLFF